jgi:hypothetical protein
MMHAPSSPSWIPRSKNGLTPVVTRDEHARTKLAISTLAVSLLLAATVIWLILAYL